MCKIKTTVYVFILVMFFYGCQTNESRKKNGPSFEMRVDALIAQMTLQEKVSQLSYTSAAIPRLNIPEYNWWNECLHGVGRSGLATVFPQAIGMAAMWDSDEMFQIANAVSDEARAKYHQYFKQGKRGIYQGLTFWSPNINIFRDPRWGRGMETYGEDPYLTGKLGVSYIKGLQGNDSVYYKVIATAKHFAVHSGPEYNRHSYNAHPSKYDYYETYTPQFKAAVEKGGVYSVMCAYNRLEGVPCCGNHELSNLLRNDWNFKGYIVSDCWAVRDFYDQKAHEVVNTKAEAAAMSLLAGTDLNCGNTYPSLIEAVEKGYVEESQIDKSLRRVLMARMKLGMFDADEDVPFSAIKPEVIDSKEHRALALDVARKSMVLLKNENQFLPLNKNIRNIAVIGPNAMHRESLNGNYHGYASHPVSVVEGLQQKLPNAQITYALGCPHANEWPYAETIPSDRLFTDSTLTINGLKAEYYNIDSLHTEPLLTRIDKTIDFEWWNLGPDKTINPNEFIVKWSGYLVPAKSGKYAIGAEGLSFVSLSVDGQLLFEKGSEHHTVFQYKWMELHAGQSYKIEMEYRQEKSEYAMARLFWDNRTIDTQNKAMAIAKEADVVVLYMGLSPQLEGEEMKVDVDGFHLGDRVRLDLPDIQQELIQQIMKLNKPTVLVLMNGSALAINWENENIPAILEAWYPGQAGGTAIADILFGDYNPSGRLPITFYKSEKQLPDFEDYNMEGRTYRYFKGEPLYRFGYGLSYTSFKYQSLMMPDTIIAGESLTVNVDVSNVGDRDGDEVVQLYVSHPKSEYKTAIRSLKGFKRIHLKAGETQTISFELTPQDMAVLNHNYQYVVGEGQIAISVGGGQPTIEFKNKQQVVEQFVNVKSSEGEIYVCK